MSWVCFVLLFFSLLLSMQKLSKLKSDIGFNLNNNNKDILLKLANICFLFFTLQCSMQLGHI